MELGTSTSATVLSGAAQRPQHNEPAHAAPIDVDDDDAAGIDQRDAAGIDQHDADESVPSDVDSNSAAVAAATSPKRRRNETFSFCHVEKACKKLARGGRRGGFSTADESIDCRNAISSLETPRFVDGNRLARIAQLVVHGHAIVTMFENVNRRRPDDALMKLQQQINAERQDIDKLRLNCDTMLKDLRDAFAAKLAQVQQDVDGAHRDACQPLNEMSARINAGISQASPEEQFRAKIDPVLRQATDDLSAVESDLAEGSRALRDPSFLNDSWSQLNEQRQRLSRLTSLAESLAPHQQRAHETDIAADNDRREAHATAAADNDLDGDDLDGDDLDGDDLDDDDPHLGDAARDTSTFWGRVGRLYDVFSGRKRPRE